MVKRAAVVAVIALAGCGPDASSMPFVRSDHCPVGGCVDASAGGDTGPVTIPNEPLEPWDTTGEGPLSGIFALETIIDARVVVPVQLRQLYRLRVVQHGTRLHIKTTLCEFKLPSVENVATLTIPPRLQALIQSKSVESEGDYLSNASTVNAAYSPPPWLLVLGAGLANPTSDPLPTLDNPAAAIDEDGDGHPGVTLRAQLLTCKDPQDLYVAMRTTGASAGNVLTPDVIEGKSNVRVDQSVVGYSDPCLSVATTIKIDVVPGSAFRAQRVGDAQDLDHNGNVSCPEIVLTAPSVFTGTWAIDGGAP